MAKGKVVDEVDEVLEKIANWSVLKLADFIKRAEEKFGVKAAVAAGPAVAVAPPGGDGAPGAAAEEEKTEFTVLLKDFGAKKIEVIKAVRELTALGLKEAKDLVEAAPKPVKEGVSKQEASAAAEKLQAAGAVAEVV